MMSRSRTTRRVPGAMPLHEVTFDNDENVPPRGPDSQPSHTRRNGGPSTARRDVGGAKSKGATVSPVLQNLMSTPGRTFQTQRLLMQKHYEAKSKEKCVGGGVSLWPEMDNMRLTSTDLSTLLASSITLLVLTVAFFYYLHGETLDHLNHFIRQLRRFTSQHPLMTPDQMAFNESLLRWHRHYSSLLEQIDHSVEVSWTTCPPTYPLVVILYISGVIMLLFYLYENVFAKSRLTPKRIKQWVRLLVVIMTWTFLMLYFLIQAKNLENLVQQNVHSLNHHMEELLFTELDLSKYESVMRYWTTRCLPPQTEGALSILGVISVHNFTYYLIYYSVPIMTALFTPIIQLIMSVYAIYRPNPD